ADQRVHVRTADDVSLEVLMGAVRRLAGLRFDDVGEDLRSILLDTDRVGSAAHALSGLRGALTSVRDQVSLDAWRALGAIDRAVAVLAATPRNQQIAESAGRILTGVLALQGVSANMVRDTGWHMLGAGRSLERALQVAHLLRITAERRGIDVDREAFSAVLAAAESAVTHRRRYRAYVRPRGGLG